MLAKIKSYRPSDKEPFMNERQREYFRAKLLAWREDILKEAKETLQHLQEENQNHPDLADRASSETDRAIELRARDRQRKLIAKIDEALDRIDDGTYGYCEETGEPISLRRLEARPDRHAVGRGAGAPRAARAGLSRRLTPARRRRHGAASAARQGAARSRRGVRFEIFEYAMPGLSRRALSFSGVLCGLVA